MSVYPNLSEASDAPDAAQTSGAPSARTSVSQSQWRLERLTEARGILADIAHHRETLVLLACQVICAHRPDSVERADALGVIRLLRAHSPKAARAAPNGGVA